MESDIPALLLKNRGVYLQHPSVGGSHPRQAGPGLCKWMRTLPSWWMASAWAPNLYRAALTLVDAMLDELEVARQPSMSPHGPWPW